MVDKIPEKRKLSIEMVERIAGTKKKPKKSLKATVDMYSKILKELLACDDLPAESCAQIIESNLPGVVF
jgi:hypothetical protein